MKNTSLPCLGLIVLLIAATAAWSQSPAVAEPAAKSYKFTAVDFPGVAGTLVYDTANGIIIDDFYDPQNSDTKTAFTMKANVAQQFTIPGFNGVPVLQAINASGEMVGQFIDPLGDGRSLEIIGGEATIFDPPDSTFDLATGVNASGTIVGIYEPTNGPEAGYLYSNGQFTTISFPGAIYTQPRDINSAGDIVGLWADGILNHGFLLKNGVYSSLDAPKAVFTEAEGIDDKGNIVGYYEDANKAFHGFLYSKGTFQTIDVPRAASTTIFRLKNNGELLGIYEDERNNFHGFTAK